MKKFVTLLLTAALAVTAATTAFADTKIEPGPDSSPNPASGDMDVTYTVKPSYTVTIPANITLNTAAPSTATVTATDVTIPNGQKVRVTLNSKNNFYVITNEGARGTYTVKKDNSTTPISVSYTHLTLPTILLV